MNEKSLITLEYNKIINMLVDRAISPMGKAQAAALLPMQTLTEVGKAQQETSEAEDLILKRGSLPLGGIKDIRTALKRAGMGGILSIEELMNVGEFLYVCRKVNNYANNDRDGELPELLSPLFYGVQTVNGLENEINRCIASENDLADDASPKLANLRQSMRQSNARVTEHLNSVIHSQTYKNMLQDSLITIRSGRYCVPVKSEYRSSFPGMIHDQSSSGATLFIEPMSVVNLNNKIKELAAEEKAEIEAILRRLSEMVASSHQVLIDNINLLTQLDFAFAKGELSLAMRGCEPILNQRGYLSFKRARHPLLDPEKVVPMDIYLGDEFSTLLITGPNTGGKTVALKTLGLFTLMGQAGLHIPASHGSELAVFDDVFADIGDEQSIEQSLSTFSSHMTNIVGILGQITPNCLVLMDELGAGTDPTEGAALAIAIIQDLYSRGVRTAITTHYSELKTYALANEGFENAACEFDVETLRPTYRLLIGVPGKSNAFAIARRLGLPDYIIADANEVLSHEDKRLEDVITDLEISRKNIELDKERTELLRREAEELRTEVARQKDKLENQRERIINEARMEARNVLSQAKNEADGIVREMTRIRQESGSLKDLELGRSILRESISKLDEKGTRKKEPQRKLKPIKKELKSGDSVFVHSLGQNGTIMTAPDANGFCTVSVGMLKMNVNIKDLALDDSPSATQKTEIPKSTARTSQNSKSAIISPKLDLRGFMVDEALNTIDKYLDDASMSGIATVEIIHGKGTGALRRAVTDFLKNHPHVKSSRLGEINEGGDGVTIVTLV